MVAIPIDPHVRKSNDHQPVGLMLLIVDPSCWCGDSGVLVQWVVSCWGFNVGANLIGMDRWVRTVTGEMIPDHPVTLGEFAVAAATLAEKEKVLFHRAGALAAASEGTLTASEIVTLSRLSLAAGERAQHWVSLLPRSVEHDPTAFLAAVSVPPDGVCQDLAGVVAWIDDIDRDVRVLAQRLSPVGDGPAIAFMERYYPVHE